MAQTEQPTLQQIRLHVSQQGNYADRDEVFALDELMSEIRKLGHTKMNVTRNFWLVEDSSLRSRPQTMAVAMYDAGFRLFFLTEDRLLVRGLSNIAGDVFGAENVKSDTDSVYRMLWGHVLSRAENMHMRPSDVYCTTHRVGGIMPRLKNEQLGNLVSLLHESFNAPTTETLRHGIVHHLIVANSNIVLGKTADFVADVFGQDVAEAAKAYDSLIAAAAVYIAPGPFIHAVRRLVEYQRILGLNPQQLLKKSLELPLADLIGTAVTLGDEILKLPGARSARILISDMAYLHTIQQPMSRPGQ